VRGRNVLVGAQVALALVLLIGAGLMFRTFDHLRSSDLGFTERQALTFEVPLPETRYGARVEAGAFHQRLLERLAALPGVEAAGAVGHCLPLAGHMCWGESLEAEGFPIAEGEVPPVTGVRIATPGYFEALGIAVRGRTLRPGDESGGTPSAVLSEAAAIAYFGSTEPIGRRISFGGEEPTWYTVVGVARDVRGRVGTDDFFRTVYLPIRPDTAEGPPPTSMTFVLRTAVPPTSLVPAVHDAVAEIDPLVPLARVRSLREVIGAAIAPTTFAMALLGIAGALALVLGMVGLYGVMAYWVSRRTAEIGVRLAVGANGADVVLMVLRQGAKLVLAGVAAGLLAAFGLSRLLESLLVGVSPTDPLSFALLTALLVAVATGALWLPARRAARVSPSVALRGE
jgi:predicted permease